MKFWDTSCIVPLVHDEQGTEALVQLYREDPQMVAWWASYVECVSSLARHEREGWLTDLQVRTCLEQLDVLADTWIEVQPSPRIRSTARRLLLVHPLRAADALQLAAALDFADGMPLKHTLVTDDERLAAAASREGFHVVGSKG